MIRVVKSRRQSSEGNTIDKGVSKHDSGDQGDDGAIGCGEPVHGAIGNRGGVTAASIPEDESSWLNLSFSASKDIVYHYLFNTVEPRETQVDNAGELIDFIENMLRYDTIGEFGKMPRFMYERIKSDVKSGKYSISPGIWAKFEKLYGTMSAIVEAKEAAEKRPAAGAAAIPAATTVTVEQFVSSVNQVLENWWETTEPKPDLSSIKLEEFKLRDSLAPLAAGKTCIKKNPVSESGRPSLLLSGLPTTTKCDIEEPLMKTVENTIAALFGVSGIGKTRRVFEMLSRNFGFYFSVAPRTSWNPTSNDFSTAVLRMTKAVGQINRDADARGERALEVVSDHVEMLLFVRLRVLLFLQEKWNRKMTPMEWLLVQLYPVKFLGEDIFDNLYDLARNYLELASSMLGEQLRRNSNTPNGLLVFVDEAQVLQSTCKERFPSNTTSKNDEDIVFNRSLLSAVGKAFHNQIVPKKLRGAVLTGTGFQMHAGFREIASTAVKSKDDTEKLEYSEMYPLNTDGVKKYIEEYIDLSKFDNDIVDHCLKWLIGRPRWTASFIEKWIYESPTLLLEYQNVSAFNFFDKSEWNRIETNLPESATLFATVNEYVRLVTATDTTTQSGYIETALSLVKKYESRSSVSNASLDFLRYAVFQYTCNGGKAVKIPRMIDDAIQAHQYVESGLCVFNKSDMAHGGPQGLKLGTTQTATFVAVTPNAKVTSNAKTHLNIELFEPLIVQASIQHFGWNCLASQRLSGSSDITGPSGQGETFEHCIAPILESMFNGGDFTNQPALRTYNKDGTIKHNAPSLHTEFLYNWQLPPLAYGVFIAENPVKKRVARYCSDVVGARFTGQIPPFSTTDNDFGGDIIGYVTAEAEEHLKRKWTICQVKLRKDLKPAEDRQAHLTTIPELIWMDSITTAYKLTKGVSQSQRNIVFSSLRAFDGVFRVVIKSSGRAPRKDNLVPGCIKREKLPTNMEAYKFKYSSKEKSRYDCLLVVDAGSMRDVLLTTCDENGADIFINSL